MLPKNIARTWIILPQSKMNVILSVESQKGAINIKQYAIEKQMGAIAVQCQWQ